MERSEMRIKRVTFGQIIAIEGNDVKDKIIFSSKGNIIIGDQHLYLQEGEVFMVYEQKEDKNEDLDHMNV